MKARTLTVAFWISAGVAFGFDPVGPPPTKTVQWTIAYTALIVVPRVDFDDSVSLGDGLKFLQLRHVMPAAYGIEIDGSALGEERLKMPIHFQAKDTKLIEVLARIADTIEADLTIGSGAISFTPKKKKPNKEKLGPASRPILNITRIMKPYSEFNGRPR